MRWKQVFATIVLLAVALCPIALLLIAQVGCDPRHEVEERDAQAKFSDSLPQRSELWNRVHLVHSQRLDGDMHGSNDYAFEFAASPDDIPRLKEAVLSYFQHEHHQDRDFKIDTSNSPNLLATYWGDHRYKPSWWTPASLPDTDVVLVSERGVGWVYVFSKARGTLFYELVSW